MSKSVKSASSVGVAIIQDNLSRPPLLGNEDPAEFNTLKARISTAITPQDFIEEIWVDDLAILQWEVMRFRRIKASLISQKSIEKVENLLPYKVETDEKRWLARGWVSGDMECIEEVKIHLKERGLNEDIVAARVLSDNLRTFAQIDQMIAHAEARRDAVTREIERRRFAVARRLRDALDTIDAVDFREVAAPKDAG